MAEDRILELKERLKAVPLLPGVYLFKDLNGEVIYVGKARVLRNRLRSYFRGPDNLDPKVKAMMMKVHEFDYVITSSELEALILECNMIKSYSPRYNIIFRDDKSYPYLKVTLQEDFPRAIITREKVRDVSRYFGPYADVGSIKETLRLLNQLFPLRTCKDFKIGRRPCLNHDIGRCLAPCTGLVDRGEYRNMVQRVISFLDGEVQELSRSLEKEMIAAAENMEFEAAASLRDSLAAIKKVAEQQKVVCSSSMQADIIAVVGQERQRLVLVFHIRAGRLIGKDTFWLNTSLGQRDEEVLYFFVQQYYSDNTDIPGEILLGISPSDQEVLEKWMMEQGIKTSFRIPARGEKKNLLTMAQDNAVLLWEESMRKSGSIQEVLAGLARLLDLSEIPERIECFDISHLGGEETVGSMVVFTNGEKDSASYRRFKLAVTNNDYQGMREILTRRMRNGLAGEEAFLPLPDLIMVDGGPGQAGVANQVIQELGADIPVIGLAKKYEEIHRPGVPEPIRLPRSSEVLKLVQRIRDESHRFAIGHNRQRIRKRSLTSVLDHIDGIGDKRKNELLKHYGSIEKIKAATIDELCQVPGMNHRAAEAVFAFFHRN
ncbi:MAG: excinuclease ABC subunit UvrC [Chitinophagales bacterium]